MTEESDAADHGDPREERARQTVTFRESDTPEVRRALVENAMARERQLHQIALEHPKSASSG